MEELILIGIVMVILFFIINKKNNKKNKKNKINKIKGGNIPIYETFRINDIVPEKKKIRIKPFINDIKFHNHYRDIMTAIDNMLPVQKEVFNRNNMPIKYEEGNYKECKNIASDFVISLKNQIKRLPDERNENTGWDEALPDPNVKSGWDKFTEKIGVPSSLYEDPAKNGNIFLIDIFNNEKHSTEDETRYITTIILGKDYVDDQIMIKLAVVKDNRCFSAGQKGKLTLEEINIIGYLSNYGDSSEPQNTREPFYAFNQMTKNDVINNHEILLELERNFIKKMDSVQTMLGTTEPDTRIFGPDLPPRSDLDSHKVTRTVFEDMEDKFF